MKFKCDSCEKRIKSMADDHHLSIGICGHTGATTETLDTLLGSFGWNVCVYTSDGRALWGEYEDGSGDTVRLRVLDDSFGPLPYKESIDWADIVHIQIG